MRTVEWYAAQYTSAGVVEHGDEVVQDDEETLVTGRAAVVLSGDSAVVIEGDVETLLKRFRFVVNELERLQERERRGPATCPRGSDPAPPNV